MKQLDARGAVEVLIATRNALAIAIDPIGNDRGSGSIPAGPASIRGLLASLSPETLPAPPPDASNAWADDPAAARLGQRIFFDPGFAGTLLDPDNVGDDSTLGIVGETGRVACAGCHVPQAGFVDVEVKRYHMDIGNWRGGFLL